MKKFLLAALCLSLLLTACGAPGKPTLTVMTHDSFAISEDVIAGFEGVYGVKVIILKSGEVGEMLNKAILTKNAPVADLLYGVDNTFLSRALAEGLFDPYQSPLLVDVPDEFKMDSEFRVTPIDYGDVCLNYDVAYFAEKNLPVPQTLEDLAKPIYKNLLVMENPATSSPGLAFLIATINHFGQGGYIQYWKQLRENGVVVVDSWETAYYTNFSGSSGKGPNPLVVSYATSPAAEVYFAAEVLSSAPTGAISGPGTCFRQVEFAGILKGTQKRDLAVNFLNYMLSVPFQEDLPLQMFVYPVNLNADLPTLYRSYAPVVEEPAFPSPQQISQSRDKWIDFWTQAVLR